MSDGRRTTERLRSPEARRWGMSGLVVLGFGAAAVAAHFWLGQAWHDVLWMAASLSFVWVVVREALEGRRRGRTGRRDR
ncbi:hypothetical protein BFF78_21850 [Streptomyces fodineus]|uniref:Uncharacterized protein n=1 Tax=Streptomyces fodineus TaxID=1904616 RepID=A0A1D7YCL5_9ACTN|nr:hypothetical protein BFF78_21850 [Streptomyces fodineus]